MTNSMNNVTETIILVESHINVLSATPLHDYQVAFEIEKEDVHKTLVVLKNAGWTQLSYLSAVDWIEDNEFEVVYVLMNWEKAVHVQVRARLDRENAIMPSIINIFEGCKYYERECYEFFGIHFPGNPMYDKQLILEQWDDLPPLRKDFDPKAYSDKKFPKRKYSNDHVNLNGEPSKKEMKDARRDRIDELIKGGPKQ
jgi:NADH-quinone oxidoreductase subunit C